MALVDMRYFNKIQAAELMSLAWTGPDKWERAPNVVTFTQRFNNVRAGPLHAARERARGPHPGACARAACHDGRCR